MIQPYFSIVIPTRCRPAALACCLRSLSRLDYPADRIEIIVVGDGDENLNIPDLESLIVRSCVQPGSGPASARNQGAGMAGGDYLAFIDDDCEAAENWLLKLAQGFDLFPDRIIGGRVINALPENRYAGASQSLVDFLYTHYNPDPFQAQFLTSNNMVVPRQEFLALGGFDSRFKLAAGEDRDFCRRWMLNGAEIIYDPSIVVYHAHPLTLRHFVQQHINYGRGARLYHSSQFPPKNRLPSVNKLSFYVKLMFFPLKQGSLFRRVKIFMLFLLMQAATTLGYLGQRFKEREN